MFGVVGDELVHVRESERDRGSADGRDDVERGALGEGRPKRLFDEKDSDDHADDVSEDGSRVTTSAKRTVGEPDGDEH